MLIDKAIDYVVWIYGQETDFVRYMKQHTFALGIPTTLIEKIPSDGFDEYITRSKHGLFVLDDLMVTVGSSKAVTDLFCNKVQHNNLSVILMLQNVFYHGSERSTLLRCAHYLVIFKNPLDASTPFHLAHRIMPSNRKVFLDIFEHATKDPYSYLFVDGRQTTPVDARFRSDLFHSDGVHYAYKVIEKKQKVSDK